MKKIERILVLCIVVAAFLCAGGCGKRNPAAPAAVIPIKAGARALSHLQEAYNSECNAAARSKLFAAKCTEEGNFRLALLFNSLSRAENVHASFLAALIRGAGAEPLAEINLPSWIGPREALLTAFRAESGNVLSVYVNFVRETTEEETSAAVPEAFSRALEAEKSHALLLGDYLQRSEQWKSSGGMIVVCTVCGFAAEKADPQITSCPVCHAEGAKLEIFQ
ncbi:MAG: ferritin family protein [Victivallaceae bacterium]|nr:ferritin family protein [Victivallaceae bacterium]